MPESHLIVTAPKSANQYKKDLEGSLGDILNAALKMNEVTIPANEAAGFTDIPESLSDEIDLLGLAESEYRASKKIVAEYEARVKMLTEQLEQHATDTTVMRARGKAFVAELPLPTQTRFVSDIPEVCRLIGAKNFLARAKFTIADVEELVAPESRAAVIGFKAGNRKLKISKA